MKWNYRYGCHSASVRGILELLVDFVAARDGHPAGYTAAVNGKALGRNGQVEVFQDVDTAKKAVVRYAIQKLQGALSDLEGNQG